MRQPLRIIGHRRSTGISLPTKFVLLNTVIMNSKLIDACFDIAQCKTRYAAEEDKNLTLSHYGMIFDRNLQNKQSN